MTQPNPPGYPWQSGQEITAQALNAQFAQCITLPNATLIANSVVVGDSTTEISSLPSTGTAGQVLTSSGSSSKPIWADANIYDPSNVAITGGSVDGTQIGVTTQSSGQFSSLLSNSTVTGTQLVSNISTGTAPLVIISTTPVANLSIGGNANTATFATASTSSTTATNSTNIVGGSSGSVPYQASSGVTTMLSAGIDGDVLTLASGIPSWAPSGGGTYDPTAVAITGGTINGVAIGSSSPNSLKATTIIATGTITPNTVAGIVGTTLGDTAQSGSVGETNQSQANVPLGTIGSGGIASVHSASLSAGYWMVNGNISFIPDTGCTITAIAGSLYNNSSSSLASSPFTMGFNNSSFPVSQAMTFPVPMQIFNLSTTTTINLNVYSVFSGGSGCAFTGSITAIRMR